MAVVDQQRFGFSPEFRLRTKASYRYVMSAPQRLALPHLLFLYRDNKLDTARLGLGIARRHVPTAVGRNIIKRLVRESFRHQRAKLGGLDIVVLTRPKSRAGNKQAIQADLDKAWHKLRNASCALS